VNVEWTAITGLGDRKEKKGKKGGKGILCVCDVLRWGNLGDFGWA